MRTPAVPLRRVVIDACDGPFGSAISTKHYVEDGVRVIRLGNIGDGIWLDSSQAFLDPDYAASLSSHDAGEGDIVVAALGDERNAVGRAALLPSIGQAVVKADCHRLRLDASRAYGPFVSYALSSAACRSQAFRLSEGTTRQRITLSKTLSLQIPLPALGDQHRIASFLDTETERIDELIATKSRMAERSVELRQSITYEAVAGSLGLESSTVKDSGIPWLPSVPSHWQDASLRLVAELGSGHTPSRSHPEWWVDCRVPWVTTGEVARLRSDRHEFIYETREKVSELGLANSSAVVHPAGTVVLCRTSASAGYSGIMSEDMATSQDFATWTCGPLLRPRFLLLCLRAMRRDLLERLGQGSTHVTIYMPDIESIRVPLPPVEEQDQIVDEAWRRMKALAEAEDVLDKQVELLQEHRRSLITAAVSGEMEVP